METVAARTIRTPVAATTRPPHGANDDAGAEGTSFAFGRLLFATDLSAASAQAAEEAIRLAAEAGAHLLVLSVVDPRGLRLPGGRFLRRVDQERARIEAGVQELVRRARAVGVRATFLVWDGDPAEAILAASAAEDIDVIVLGSHGRGPLGRILLGSTSAHVADKATCRVIVVAG